MLVNGSTRALTVEGSPGTAVISSADEQRVVKR
jgi:hypothetical protein